MRRTLVGPILVILVLAMYFLSGCLPVQDPAKVQGDAAPQPAPMTIETTTDKIANALSAGPSSVTDNAAIMDWPSEDNPELKELRPGTNGWVCLPDDSNTPINDPVCFDEAWMDWIAAFATGQEPETTSLGFSYMLQGGSAVSDADPYAELAEGDGWLVDPPHLMVLVPVGMDVSRFPTDRESGEPYVMWAGTPYEHFMIPLDEAVPTKVQSTDKIANALTAGPASVTDGAAILDWPSEGSSELTELRAGTNGWVCLPDDANTPINDPVCFDEAWMDWIAAFATGQEPETTSLGFSYMLQGGSAVSDADPYAELAEGDGWLVDPPHLMVLVPVGMDVSRFPTDRESGEPYVMWAGTPYEHFMIPLDNLDANE